MLDLIEAARPRARCSIAALLSCSTLATAAIAVFVAPHANAQIAPYAPVRQSIDANGVDLFLGTFAVDLPPLSAGGGGPAGLAWQRHIRGGGMWYNDLVAGLTVDGSTVYVGLGADTDRFTISGASYIPTEGNGASLTLSGSVYTYTTRDGTIIHFNKAYIGGPADRSTTGVITDLTKPSGERLTYNFESLYYCSKAKEGANGYICTGHSYAYRISSVQSASGYKLTFNNAPTQADSTDIDGVDWNAWSTTYGVSMTNTAVAGASVRTETIASTFAVNTRYDAITDAVGRTTTLRTIFNGSTQGVAGIKRPGSSGEDVTVTYDASNRVFSVTSAAGTITYTYSDAGGFRTTTVTDPLGHANTYVFAIASQRMTSSTNAVGNTTSWQYDGSGRVTRATAPEGNYTQSTYDGRGNVTEVRAVAKPASGLADVVTTASYDASCTSAAKCNQPNWTRDARGNQTDFSYNVTTGNVSSVVAPAATAGAPRPTRNYSYTAVNGVQLLSGSSTCQTAASCVGTADEVKTTVAYNSNMLPTSVTTAAGDGSLSATTTIGYDDVGNPISVDGPLPGAGDTTITRYNADREVIGVVSADPDGGGALKPRAKRITYDVRGRQTLVEIGTVNSQSDGDWSGFASQQQVATGYDGADRKIISTVTGGGATYQVAQYSYDQAGRLACTALRMNPASWTSQPDACVLAAAGSAGPDRITRNSYDAADRIIQVQAAYGTSDQSNEVSTSYTPNGKPASVTDGEGNRTGYEYDGFDRSLVTRYPITNVGAATSSASDYEQLSYDASGNVTSWRLRDGQVIGFVYDNLNRRIFMDRSNSGIDEDVSYGFDLLNRMTSSGTPWGHRTNYNYDALGRAIIETNTYGPPLTSQYDLAGRRTRLSWGDGFFVDYDYNLTGEVTAIRENGATSGVGVLATYSYDSVGRRSSVTHGNGTVTTYSYDPVSRLAALTQDLGGSSFDFTHAFSYNPANQIASVTHSNDTYAWGGHYNVDRSYSANGLNQLVNAGNLSLGYDGRGNLITSGTNSYSYGQLNQLVSFPGGTLYYDTLGRMDLVYASNAQTALAYDGSNLVAEYIYGSGALLRRYVPGPSVDEPVVWYEGSGTNDRRWLHADERGSVVAVSDGSGNAIAINRYDEYGIPASSNIGRFQYTGQVWMPELGMYYYKARVYSPTLGRFMQTDPIGYHAGLNLYNYVDSDPLNQTDPTGLCPPEQGGGDGPCGFVVQGKRLKKPQVIDSGGGGSLGFPRGSGTSGGAPGAPGGGGKGPAPKPQPCGNPSNVNIDGTLVVSTATGGIATFTGTLTDVSSGRSFSFVSKGQILGEGGSSVGIGLGHFSVSGTVRGFDALSSTFAIGFATVGIGPASWGSASITNSGGSAGNIEVNGSLAIPAAATLNTFDGATLKEKSRGSCK